MIKSLDNYRKLKPTEKIRRGDVYVSRGTVNFITPVKHSIGSTPGARWYSGHWDFYRRRHTKKVSVVSTPAPVAAPVASTKPKPSVPIVSFVYHGTVRRIQVIKMDDTYLKGLEITQVREGRNLGFKNKYQFKSFRRDGISGHIWLESYGPAQ